MATTIVLFHHDFRLADHHALAFAAARGAVVPVYILAQDVETAGKSSSARRWWLRESLKDLALMLHQYGVELVLKRGNVCDVVQALAQTTGATAVTWNRRYEPNHVREDEALSKLLQQHGMAVFIHEGFLLFEPGSVLTRTGTAFKVFTPFSRACLSALPPPKPLAIPARLRGVAGIASDAQVDWLLVPSKAQWTTVLAENWAVTERAAQQRLDSFVTHTINAYETDRDRPDIDGTSRLSPYLHGGQISPAQVWHTVHKAGGNEVNRTDSLDRYVLELLWREFSWHLLHWFPMLADRPMVRSFEFFPWRDDQDALQAWQSGMTGYPIVDAGMRQLWQTGWMHNRVRMIVASFLVKHLLIDWRAGAAWFRATLVDADLGSNSASWQWVTGCGVDAAPFFRIFNPMLQGKKFDPHGAYVRQYVPELAHLNVSYIHEPWLAPVERLKASGIRLGITYPAPIVEHDFARQRALAAYASLRSAGSASAI